MSLHNEYSIAIHESGHAVMSVLLGKELDHVSIDYQE
jgi:hypothetical protein